MCRANASEANTSPSVSIEIPNVITRTNVGSVGGSVFCYQTINLTSGKQIKVSFSNITTSPQYNSYFIAYMNKYF